MLMMPDLFNIKNFVQQIAEAVAAVVGIDVTIFNDSLLRVAGTGRYLEQVGQRINPTAAFAKVLQNGRPAAVFNPTVNKECLACELKASCSEIANIAYPITMNNRVKGVLALIAFDEEQRLKLIKQKDIYINFLSRMAELISSKLIEQGMQAELMEASQRLQGIVDAFSDGVVFVNQDRKVISCNPAAARILATGQAELRGQSIAACGFPALESLFLATLQEGRELVDKEIVQEGHDFTRRYLCSTRAVCHEGQVIGAIVFLKDYEAIYQMVNEAGGNKNYFGLDEILGDHPLIQGAKETARKASLTDSTVLIQGESGTGKELFARGIHGLSRRKNGPFVAINCAAIPDTLLESELFGYEGGAFTGAKSKGKPGKFELASGGTIFLDEIGDMPLSLQAKLLRVLEERKITRLGGISATPVDVRVIAATNKDLETMVAKKEFREDLFYRLSVIPLKIPPLRERKSDIPVLAAFFLQKYKRLYGKEIKGFAPPILALLQQYDWPGNVRELQNVLEYAVNMAEGSLIQEKNIPEKIRNRNKTAEIGLAEGEELFPLKEAERILLQRGLTIFGTTDKAKTEIARRLGISRASVYRKLKTYGLT
ncbi:MAG: sigma-54 dependent transcriptional regulator, acetoin dehydrogenase operon transcriptional [Clostridia bacterium]|nr:sigma-54 dependent transcriptional regulator, acetoin dehydrogenase operon transcriptional [Clostridia bacterium]